MNYIEQTYEESLMDACAQAYHRLGRKDEARKMPGTKRELEDIIKKLSGELK